MYVTLLYAHDASLILRAERLIIEVAKLLCAERSGSLLRLYLRLKLCFELCEGQILLICEAPERIGQGPSGAEHRQLNHRERLKVLIRLIEEVLWVGEGVAIDQEAAARLEMSRGAAQAVYLLIPGQGAIERVIGDQHKVKALLEVERAHVLMNKLEPLREATLLSRQLEERQEALMRVDAYDPRSTF
jgi:hypothetical protein